MRPKYLCVLDFEATCWTTDTLKEEMEIIEFPSVLYRVKDAKGPKGVTEVALVDEFHSYVRPVRHPILSEFCVGLTGITQDIVDAADLFDVVFARHRAWLTAHVGAEIHRTVFVTCGHWDLRTMLPRVATGLDSMDVYRRYINIKDDFTALYGRKAGSMTDMLSKLRIPLTGRHHSGIDDTRNIAKVLLQMMRDGYTTDRMTVCVA